MFDEIVSIKGLINITKISVKLVNSNKLNANFTLFSNYYQTIGYYYYVCLVKHFSYKNIYKYT